jgi:palmitoyltransferase ZDHHC4
MYGVYLGYSILDGTLQKHFLVRSSPSQHWSRGKDWGTYVNLWALVIADNVRLGVTFLLAAMTAPLAISFLCYHLYLIWAGMTTNETAKWDDWKADITERLVFKSKKSRIYGQLQRKSDGGVPKSSWPGTSDQILILTDGEPPRAGFMLDSLSNFIAQPKDEDACIDQRWDQVRSLREIENVYDLGFWGNLCDALGLPINEIYS